MIQLYNALGWQGLRKSISIFIRPLHKWREEKGREEDKKWKKERELV